MTIVILTAVGASVGLLGLIRAVRPSPPSLPAALGALERDGASSGSGADLDRRWPGLRIDRRVGERLAGRLATRGDLPAYLKPMLAVTGTSMQTLCGEVVLGGAVGLLLPAIGWTVMTVGGVRLPIVVPVWTGLALAGLGGALPLLVLRSRADHERRSARRLVGSFLNLVVLCLAGGMGVESALHASAGIGGDPVSERILGALALAQDSGMPPWGALDQVGRDLGVSELTDLAAVVALAGAEGARVRNTLAAKAGSIRRRDLAEAEARANSTTERLFLPGVLLLVGFLVFIAYPAVVRISFGL